MKYILVFIFSLLGVCPFAFPQTNASEEYQVQLEYPFGEYAQNTSEAEVEADDVDEIGLDPSPRKKSKAKVKNEEEGADQPLVELEYYDSSFMQTTDKSLTSYKDRRDRWGTIFSVAFSFFHPLNYNPNFSGDSYETVYGSGIRGLYEFTGSAKLNMPAGALTLGLGLGVFSAKSVDGQAQGSSLLVIPVRVEASFVLDTLTEEPYGAPYVLGGVYANVFSEKQSAVAFKGNTQAAPYFGAGINFQLNWLERGKAEDAYWEYGLENTYLYVEGRQFVSSGAAQDPDFGTSFQLAAGAKVEY